MKHKDCKKRTKIVNFVSIKDNILSGFKKKENVVVLPKSVINRF